MVLSMVYRLWAGWALSHAAMSALDGAAVTHVFLELCRVLGRPRRPHGSGRPGSGGARGLPVPGLAATVASSPGKISFAPFQGGGSQLAATAAMGPAGLAVALGACPPLRPVGSCAGVWAGAGGSVVGGVGLGL